MMIPPVPLFWPAESGLLGTSDSFAAAVWTADLSFEFAAAGATGIHFHWSFGSTPYSGMLHINIHSTYAGTDLCGLSWFTCARGIQYGWPAWGCGTLVIRGHHVLLGLK